MISTSHRVLLLAILLALAVSEMAFGSEDQTKKGCEFAGLRLPESYAIFAAGGYSGRKIDFQIDKSGHQTTQMDVTVNYSSKPVVLMLGAYEPTIWNIKWTATTRIAAVFASGYHRQAVAGLDTSVPVLNSSYDNKGPCGYFHVGRRENPAKLNQTSRSLFGRPVDLVYLAKNGEALIGDPVPAGEKLITSESNPPESFYDRTALIAGLAGLEEAVEKGLLRKATGADVEAWVNAEIANAPKRDAPPIAGESHSKRRRPGIYHAYVVLKPFAYPAGLWGENAATFFIPKGVSRPEGNPGHSNVCDFNRFKIEQAPEGTVDLQQKPSIREDDYYVRSKKAHGTGKYYFEVTVNHGNIKQNLEADLQIGVKGGGKFIATDYRIGRQDLVIHTSSGGSVTIVGGNPGDIHLKKVVIGVAVDLDSRRFYCHREGNWMGKPPGHESGSALPSGDEFYAEIASSVSMPELLSSHIVSLNFGEQPFAYPAPIGYVAFDAANVILR